MIREPLTLAAWQFALADLAAHAPRPRENHGQLGRPVSAARAALEMELGRALTEKERKRFVYRQRKARALADGSVCLQQDSFAISRDKSEPRESNAVQTRKHRRKFGKAHGK